MKNNPENPVIAPVLVINPRNPRSVGLFVAPRCGSTCRSKGAGIKILTHGPHSEYFLFGANFAENWNNFWTKITSLGLGAWLHVAPTHWSRTLGPGIGSLTLCWPQLWPWPQFLHKENNPFLTIWLRIGQFWKQIFGWGHVCVLHDPEFWSKEGVWTLKTKVSCCGDLNSQKKIKQNFPIWAFLLRTAWFWKQQIFESGANFLNI